MMRKLIIVIFVGLVLFTSACSFDKQGSAHLLLSNDSALRVHCLIEDGLGPVGFWVESHQERSELLPMGDYQIKVEIYSGSQVVGARLFTLSLTAVGKVHQIVVNDTWIDAGGA